MFCHDCHYYNHALLRGDLNFHAYFILRCVTLMPGADDRSMDMDTVAMPPSRKEDLLNLGELS